MAARVCVIGIFERSTGKLLRVRARVRVRVRVRMRVRVRVRARARARVVRVRVNPNPNNRNPHLTLTLATPNLAMRICSVTKGGSVCSARPETTSPPAKGDLS